MLKMDTSRWNTRKIAILSLTLISLILIILPTQSASASSITKHFDSESATITYRFIPASFPTPEPVVSLGGLYHPGQIGTVIITDYNANLDPEKPEQITAVVNSEIKTFDETDINSGIFETTFTATSANRVEYLPIDQPHSGSITVTLNLSSAADVKVTDVEVDDALLSGVSFIPVTDIIDVDVVGGTPLEGTTVSMSFANADLVEQGIADFVDLYYKKPGEAWVKITDFTIDTDGSSRSGLTLTINSDLGETGYGITSHGKITEGQFVLALDSGFAGGGGGGLIRPGLVLNLLAGIAGTGGGLDMSPPSLHFGTPTNTQDGFGGIMVTDDNKNTFPLVINGKGYYLPEFSTFIDRKSTRLNSSHSRASRMPSSA